MSEIKKQKLNELENEYAQLEQHILDNEKKGVNCEKELNSLNEILDTIAYVSHKM